MSDVFEKLVEGLYEIFPDLEDTELTPDTELGQLPDWDSMSAVNLQTFIEQSFNVIIRQDLLGEETKIGEVVDMVLDPKKIEAAV